MTIVKVWFSATIGSEFPVLRLRNSFTGILASLIKSTMSDGTILIREGVYFLLWIQGNLHAEAYPTES